MVGVPVPLLVVHVERRLLDRPAGGQFVVLDGGVVDPQAAASQLHNEHLDS